MVGLSLFIAALALVLGGDAGPFAAVLWWAAIALAAASAIRTLIVAQRARLRPDDPMDALGGIVDLMQRRRVHRARSEAQTNWGGPD